MGIRAQKLAKKQKMECFSKGNSSIISPACTAEMAFIGDNVILGDIDKS